MVYVLVMVILGSGDAASINEPIRIGTFHSLENCLAGANEAKTVGLDKVSYGFVCVRSNDVPPIRVH
jgi:hypothetical protein